MLFLGAAQVFFSVYGDTHNMDAYYNAKLALIEHMCCSCVYSTYSTNKSNCFKQIVVSFCRIRQFDVIHTTILGLNVVINLTICV